MATFTNWVGNQSCSPAQIVAPASEEEVQAAVRDARQVRCVAAGHSFTPVHLTDGTLLTMDGLHGVLGVDGATGRASALPGTTVAELGLPLWNAGFALGNQGDIDTQGIAGAIGTCTHGSGLKLQSFSASLRRARLVIASGEVIEVGEDDPRLPAVQTSVGMLGVMTEVEIQAVPAHRLVERIEHWHHTEAFGRLDELARSHRHYSFFYIPTEESAALYDLDTPPGASVADTCYVKIYDLAGDDVPDSVTPGRRVGRSYDIYPAVFEPNFHELEYFVPYDARRRGARGDARADAVAAAAVDLPDGGAHRGARGRVAVALLRPRLARDLGLRSARHRLRALPARGARRAWPVRRPRALGQDPLPDGGASCTSATRGRPTSSPCAASSTRTASS